MASRFGTLTLARQVLSTPELVSHVMPGNRVLPAHEGMIITRGLQELACLLPQDLPFAPVARLLGWQTGEEQVLSDTTIRSLVRSHGQILRQAEQAEVARLLEQPDLTSLTPQLLPNHQPRRRAGWPAALSAAVDAALQNGEAEPPPGVTLADWERVLDARRQEASRSLAELRCLGPELEPDQVLVTTDEVLTRRPVARRFWEIRTARVVTATGSRYLSGTGTGFLTVLLVLVLLCCGRQRSLLLIADGARWIREWFAGLQGYIPSLMMILDWWHLRKKCAELGSMICRGRKAKAALLRRVYRLLWHGEVAAAIETLESYRAETKNEAKLDELIGYLRQRQAYIPNYRQRRRECCYIGSGQVEKANDLIVAKRQKGKGMHWSLETSDALAALRTLLLNGGWDRYWRHREVLPLVAT